MEFIPQDSKLAPEFCNFLGEKLKDTKALLDAAVQENELLRREIHTLRSEPRRLVNHHRMDSVDEKPRLGCREGNCPSTHEVQLLQERNEELEEQINSQNLAHQTEMAQMKEKLEAAILKYKECKLKLRTCRQELQDSRGLPDESQIDNVEQKDHETGERAHEEESRMDPDDNTIWKQLSAKPCLPSNCRTPSHIPADIQRLRNGDIMFFPGRTVFGSSGSDATILATCEKYDPSAQDEDSLWAINKELSGYCGKTCELFYASGKNLVHYAGTFKCSSETTQLSRTGFMSLSSTVKGRLFPYAFNCPLQAVPRAENQKIKSMYQRGKISIRSLHAERIGFNRLLMDALSAAMRPMPVPIPIPSHSGSGTSKRKYDLLSTSSQVAGPSKKTKK